MAVFKIEKPAANEDSYTVAVNGKNYGASVDANQFRELPSKVGLSAEFSAAASNVEKFAETSADMGLGGSVPNVERAQKMSSIVGLGR